MEENLSYLFQLLMDFAASFGARLLGAILILIIGFRLVKWVLKLVGKGKKFSALPENVKTLIIDLIKVALYVLLIVIIASTMGIETASISAAIASAGLAIGLAMQGSLSNFAGGIMILVFHPFSVGDYIDDGSHAGTVTDIGIFYTTLLTVDNKTITIPNGSLSNTAVTDYSAKENRRIDLTINVAYNSDIAKVKEVLYAVAEADERILKDPAPAVLLAQHGENALSFAYRVWVKNENYWDVNFDLMEKTKLALDYSGIKIPYNQLDVHIDQK